MLIFVLSCDSTFEPKNGKKLSGQKSRQEVSLSDVKINGFSKDGLTPIDFVSYVSDLNLSDHYNDTLLSWTLSYRPVELIVLQEIGKLKGVDKGIYEELLAEFSGLEYYVLSRKGKLTTTDLSYYEYSAQNDFHLALGDDTLKCMIYHFESNSINDTYNFILGFDKAKNDSLNRVMIFNDNSIKPNREINFLIKGVDIKNIPPLKI